MKENEENANAGKLLAIPDFFTSTKDRGALSSEAWDHDLLHSEPHHRGRLAVFKRGRNGHHHFETVLLVHRKPHPMDERGYDLVEAYPSAKEWGTFGFTCHSFQKSIDKLNEIRLRFSAKGKTS